jgi:hypothetical protein
MGISNSFKFSPKMLYLGPIYPRKVGHITIYVQFSDTPILCNENKSDLREEPVNQFLKTAVG